MRLVLLTSLVAAAVLAGCAKTEPAPEPIRAVRTVTVSEDTAGGVRHLHHRPRGGPVRFDVGYRVAAPRRGEE